MKYLIILLVVVLLLCIVVLTLYFIVRRKAKQILGDYFNAGSFKEALEKSEIESAETPKSLSSMDSIYMTRLEKDFPDLNINELKSESEKLIIDVLKAIDNKDDKALLSSSKINGFIRSRIGEKSYSNIKIHKTVLNRYERKESIATIYLASSLEYVENGKKIQTRFMVEYIYIIDSLKVGSVKALGLNCPNCGAPVKKLGHKSCEYCGTGVLDIVKKNWIANNIREY